jgi:hypothetical protein
MSSMFVLDQKSGLSCVIDDTKPSAASPAIAAPPVDAGEGSTSTIFFVSDRSGKPAIWALEAVGEATLVAELPVAVGDVRTCGPMQVSGDGAWRVQCLVFTAEVYVDTQPPGAAAAPALASSASAASPAAVTDLAKVAEADAARKASATSIQTYDALPVRHWDAWDAYAKRNHVLAVAVARRHGGSAGAAGAARWHAGPYCDLMAGLASDCPVKPFGGIDDCFASAPDGRTAALVFRDATKNREMMWSTFIGVHTASIPRAALVSGALAAAAAAEEKAQKLPAPKPAKPAAAADGDSKPKPAVLPLTQADLDAAGDSVGAPKLITPTQLTMHTWPCFSPDGAWLAFLAMDRPGYEADAYRLTLHHCASGQQFQPCRGLDVSFSELRWSDVAQAQAAGTASSSASSKTYVLLAAADVHARTRTAVIVAQATTDGHVPGITVSAGVALLALPHSTFGAVQFGAATPLSAGYVELPILYREHAMTAPVEVFTARVAVPLSIHPSSGLDPGTPVALGAAATAAAAAPAVPVRVVSNPLHRRPSVHAGTSGTPAPASSTSAPALALVSDGSADHIPVLPVAHIKQITSFNTAIVAQLDLPKPQHMWFTGNVHCISGCQFIVIISFSRRQRRSRAGVDPAAGGSARRLRSLAGAG